MRLALAVGVGLFLALPVHAGDIEWSIDPVHRFRLFEKADAGSQARVAALMTAMASAQGDQPITSLYGQVVDTLSGDGASSLRHSNWDPVTHRYAKDYLYPKSYQVRANVPGRPNGRCVWIVGTTTLPETDCSADVVFDVPAALSEKHATGHADVRVQRNGGDDVADGTINIKDTLVVALGDSFISGEGNPDRPSYFKDGAGHPVALGARELPPQGDCTYRKFPFNRTDWGNKPLACQIEKAAWWDEPCHRSLLSWPVLVTMYAAARDPHATMTFVHLGCSGGAIKKGILGFQPDPPGARTLGQVRRETDRRKWKDKKSDRETDYPPPQLKALTDLLGYNGGGRGVDKVFVSVGGNDSGFGNVVQYVVIPPNGYGPAWRRRVTDRVVVPMMYGEKDEGPVKPYTSDDWMSSRIGGKRASAQERLEGLPALYETLKRELAHLPGYQGDQVYQITYPDMLRDSTGDICRTVVPGGEIDDPVADGLPHTLRGPAMRRAATTQAREFSFWLRHGKDINAFGGFEALQGVVPLDTDVKWAFQLKYEPNLVTAKPDGVVEDGCMAGQAVLDSQDSEVCKAYWVWSELNRQIGANANGDTYGKNRWTIIDTAPITRGHGWCEYGDRSLNMPLWITAKDDVTGHWSPYSPTAYQPYDPASPRWVRTANDSLLTQWRQSESGEWQFKRLFVRRLGDKNFFHNGSFHPTLNAHIRIADAVYVEAFVKGTGSSPGG